MGGRRWGNLVSVSIYLLLDLSPSSCLLPPVFGAVNRIPNLHLRCFLLRPLGYEDKPQLRRTSRTSSPEARAPSVIGP